MMRLLIGLAFLLCLQVKADVPVTGYYLVDTKELYGLLASSGKDVSRRAASRSPAGEHGVG